MEAPNRADTPSRFTTNLGDGTHIADADLPAVEGEDAGVPGGRTDAMREAEEARAANMPVVGPVDGMPTTPHSGGAHAHTPAGLEHDVDPDSLHPMERARHNMFAQENMDGPGPDRMIPGGPTNAHPDFAVDQFGNPEPNDSGLTTTRHLSTTGRHRYTQEEWDAMSDEDKAKEAAVVDEAAAGPDSVQQGKPVEELVPTGAAAKAAKETIAADRPDVDPDATPGGISQPWPELGTEEQAAGPPAAGALKGEWVDYVVANYEITREAAESLTKSELVETYGR